MQMKGLGGLNGWSWIFIIQGLIVRPHSPPPPPHPN